eukprot:TRINITY_DN14532_c0_g4_i3.p1 TRINITY_DN14532_c0_g4~~TRINITY_DN14532_c0_g4_i3.p1  ORF type:complete len:297 (+),score=74.66 TRINITY_DN14532_c0_g4_i3:231-1121(+)
MVESWRAVWIVLCCAVMQAQGAVEMLEEEQGPKSWVGQGALEMSTMAGSAETGWAHVAIPAQFRWSEQCLQLRTEAKVDEFSCNEDPGAEAVWINEGEQMRQWGDQSMCLATEENSDQVRLQTCAEMGKDDGWSVPSTGGALGEIKSLKQDKCLVPSTGSGARPVRLGSCGTAAMKWKRDALDGKLGTCAQRWPVTVGGKVDQTGVPMRRVCYHSTGSSLGQWQDHVMFADLDQHEHPGRMIDNQLKQPTSAETQQACADMCTDTPGCHGFNYNVGEASCERVRVGSVKDLSLIHI